MSLSAYGHDSRLVRIFKHTLLFVYPYLLFGLENVSQVTHHLLPLALGKDGNVAIAQCASDNTLDRCG